MSTRVIFIGIIIFLLPVIFILSFEIADLNDRLRYKQDEVNYLLEKVKGYEEEIVYYKYIIKDSIVNDANKNKVVNYMYGVATAYHPPSGGINADNKPEVTSIGLPARVGIIAVNPERIPYGSQIMIISGNTVIRGIAGDTGGAMRQNSNQVDILMSTKEKAIQWGKRKVHIIWWEE